MRAQTYAARHNDSPIAGAAWGTGTLKVTDRVLNEITWQVSTRDMQRAYGFGIISRSEGLPTDMHQHDSGLWPDVNEDEYLIRWINTALDHADGKAWSDQTEPAPDILVSKATCDYLLRLVHKPKLDYATACVNAILDGKPMPRSMSKWAPDVQARITRFQRMV